MTLPKFVRVLSIGAFVFPAALLAAACGSDNEATREVTDTVDCAKICNRYSDCVTDIDVTDCTNDCEDRADVDPNFRAQAQNCEDCTSDKACSEMSACWNNCPVPVN